MLNLYQHLHYLKGQEFKTLQEEMHKTFRINRQANTYAVLVIRLFFR